jgi:hypothetical protein
MIALALALCVACFAAVSKGTATSSQIEADAIQTDRAADAAAIRAHIESIFQAFIDGDQDKIFATHSSDWRGFLEGSRAPIKGIDDYMRANGFQWPRSATEPRITRYYPPDTTYSMSDFDVNFYAPDIAVASFFGGFDRKEGDSRVVLRRFRIMDVYAKRQGGWIQVASHTVVDPVWRNEQTAQLDAVSPQIHAQILAAREAVWRAWFANDRPALERMIPTEAIAINNGSEGWSDRSAILSGAQRFADSGAKLVKLEFPKTEMQVYGNTIIIYTNYLFETEMNGRRNTTKGRGTEIFVKRGNELVNVGWHLDSGT